MAKQDDFRFEPEAIDTDQPIPLPIGTVDEVLAEGMDVAKVPTCHEPVEGGPQPIRGCDFARINPDTGMSMCKLVNKGVDGPRNFAFKVQKGRVQGGKMFIAQHACFFAARHKDAIEENGGSLTIVAREGEKYRSVMATPETKYRDTVVSDQVVTPFPRPKDNPELAFEILKALERAEMAKEKSERAAERG